MLGVPGDGTGEETDGDEVVEAEKPQRGVEYVGGRLIRAHRR